MEDKLKKHWAAIWCDETEEIVRNLWGNSLGDIADKVNEYLAKMALKNGHSARGHCGIGSVAYTAVRLGLVNEEEAKLLVKNARRRNPINDIDRNDILKRDKFSCLKCGETKRLQIDHIKPKRFGGKDEFSNYQTLCQSCNLQKGLAEIDYRRAVRRVGRNDTCPCGTGRKYKNCCSRIR